MILRVLSIFKIMKILFVVNADWYFCLHWLARARSAVESGYEIYVLSPKTSPEYTAKIEEAGCIKIDLKLDRSSLNLFSEILLVKDIYHNFKKIKPDLVHTITLKPNLYGLFISRFLRIPIVASVTGLGIVFSDKKKAPLKNLLISLYRIALKGARPKKLLFESQEDMDYFIRLKLMNSQDGVKVNGAGVDTEAFAPREMQSENGTVFLFAARLLKSKGIMQLVEAFDTLPKELSSKAELIVCGIEDEDSPDGLSKEDIGKIEKSKNVSYLGQRDDINELMSSVDVVCLPTLYGEGIPRILIEGAASGKALIASNRGGCKEICKNGYNGMLLDDVSANSLKDVITDFIGDNKKLSSYGDFSRKLVLESFDQRFIISQNLEIYSEMLEKNNLDMIN